ARRHARRHRPGRQLRRGGGDGPRPGDVPAPDRRIRARAPGLRPRDRRAAQEPRVNARSRKVLGDLRANKPRAVPVGLSIAVAVAAIGMVTGARAMMLRSLGASRHEGAFPSATLTADAIPPRLLPQVRSLPGVDVAELRHVVGVRAAARTMTLFAVPDWRRVKLARI